MRIRFHILEDQNFDVLLADLVDSVIVCLGKAQSEAARFEFVVFQAARFVPAHLVAVQFEVVLSEAARSEVARSEVARSEVAQSEVEHFEAALFPAYRTRFFSQGHWLEEVSQLLSDLGLIFQGSSS